MEPPTKPAGANRVPMAALLVSVAGLLVTAALLFTSAVSGTAAGHGRPESSAPFLSAALASAVSSAIAALVSTVSVLQRMTVVKDFSWWLVPPALLVIFWSAIGIVGYYLYRS